ncbi:hypothetical protein NDN08_007047 [Rhodosorus marinus]|uniref:Anaphase-promoting complex subunit 4 WD40 domain-containing protein n=2 Tax=Rhodosorus marinus TaxID=101924 RepID=A0AAV8UI47_9RHOD|nr:hypothetical protein NDN08_007047 [Rhodosorus marinus]
MGETTEEVQMTEATLKQMKKAKVFKQHEKRVNCIDFSMDGSYLISSGDDEALLLYNCLEGTIHKTIKSKKYGCGFVRFTHHNSAVLYASKAHYDDSIRYLSVHDNRYLRYFKGHRHRVCCLALSPINDTFISAAKDDTVRLWDLKSNQCAGLLRTKGIPQVAFDPSGVCFGVAYSEAKTYKHHVKLFDARRFEEGPFISVSLPMTGRADSEIAQLKFSPNTKHMLLSTYDGSVMLLDAFDGSKIRDLPGIVNTQKSELECSFSPDGEFICAGSEDGRVIIWQTETGKVVHELGGHAFPVSCAAFNPRYLQMASACQNVVLWLPDST